MTAGALGWEVVVLVCGDSGHCNIMAAVDGHRKLKQCQRPYGATALSNRGPIDAEQCAIGN